MKNIKIIILFISIILVSASCKKNTSETTGSKPKSGQGILKSGGDGNVIYVGTPNSVYTNVFSQTSGSIIVSEVRGGLADVINNPSTVTVQAGLISGAAFTSANIGSNVFPMGTGNQIQIASYKTGPVAEFTGLFSQSKQPISLIDINGKTLFSTSVYFPSIIDVKTTPTFNIKNGNGLLIKSTTGVTLNWNADSHNPNGIAIVLQDVEQYETSNPIYIFSVPDNGSYTITSEYLTGYVSNLPKGQQYAHLKAQIYRGDNQIVTGTDGNKYAGTAISEWDLVFGLE